MITSVTIFVGFVTLSVLTAGKVGGGVQLDRSVG